MKDFYDIAGYENFVRESHKLMIDTLGEFFSAEVRLHFKPLSESQYYNVDIRVNPRRNVYHIDQNNVLLVCYVTNEADVYYLGILITAGHIGELKKIFNVTAMTISRSLNRCVPTRFRNAVIEMGDRLIVNLIGKYLSPWKYSYAKVVHLVDKFVLLRATTFEGKYFSTGLLLTKSLHDYKKEDDEGRGGELLRLNKTTGYLSRIENRFWYLADGYRTIFVTDLKSDIDNMFVRTLSGMNHLEKMILYKTLRGGDALFRVESGREVSVITSKGIEFINQENCWRYRDYELLKKRILNTVTMDEETYNSLLYYVLFCSKNDVSSLIWIPKDLKKYKASLKSTTINKLSRTNFKITNHAFSPLIKRMLSSDGATVISGTGEVVAYGCMVEMSKAKVSGLKGTGETAAGQLAKNGVAIKVSQDGTIKVFLNGRDKAIKF